MQRLLQVARTLLISLMACTTPVVVPQPKCVLPDVPSLPVLSAASAVVNGQDMVTLTPTNAVDLGLWIRAERRWHDVAVNCLHVGAHQ